MCAFWDFKRYFNSNLIIKPNNQYMGEEAKWERQNVWIFYGDGQKSATPAACEGGR